MKPSEFIVWREVESDAGNFALVASSKKFAGAPSKVKTATLAKYFDVEWLFSRLTPQELPTRYLRTYEKVEKVWGKDPFLRGVSA